MRLTKWGTAALLAVMLGMTGCANDAAEKGETVAAEVSQFESHGFNESDISLVASHLAAQFAELEQIRNRLDAATIGINARNVRKLDEQAVLNRAAFSQQLLRALRQHDSLKLRYVNQTGSVMEGSSAMRNGVSGSKQSAASANKAGSNALGSTAKTATYTLQVEVRRAPLQDNGAIAQEYLFRLSETATQRVIWEQPFLLDAPAVP